MLQLRETLTFDPSGNSLSPRMKTTVKVLHERHPIPGGVKNAQPESVSVNEIPVVSHVQRLTKGG